MARKVIPRGLPIRRRVAYPTEHGERDKETGRYGGRVGIKMERDIRGGSVGLTAAFRRKSWDMPTPR